MLTGLGMGWRQGYPGMRNLIVWSCLTWCLDSAGRNKMRNYINNSLIVRAGGCQAIVLLGWRYGLEAGLTKDAKSDHLEMLHGVWRALGAIGCRIL